MNQITSLFQLCLITSFFVFIGCSNNEDTNNVHIIENLVATVKKQAACNTSSNGAIYEIELDEAIKVSDEYKLKFIGITNLPEGLKIEETRIIVDIRQAGYPDGVCATIYFAEYFFEVTKANLYLK